MNIKATLSMVGATLLLSGCATQKIPDHIQADLNKPIFCNNEIECKEMWERATYFVTANSGFKLQIHNDIVIQTYSPPQNSPALAFKITKEPKGDGKYQIWTSAACNNIFGCQPNQYVAISQAKRYIRHGI